MAVVFRYVDKSGDVIERFVGIQHVRDTTSNSLKEAIDILFAREELSISMLRGQGYDGASNMKALVAVAKGNADIATFFTSCNSLVNIVGASCKRRDILRDQLQKDVTEALEKDTFPTRRGLNQETCLKRPGDTRWNSHYGTLLSIISMFKSVVKVLKFIIEDGSTDNLGEANRSLREIQSFEFVFHLCFMRSILGATNDLSQALQRKDQDIENAMTLVKVCKDQLQHMRENAFEALLDQVSSFCAKHDILVPNMDDAYVAQWRSHRRAPIITHLHHYRVDIFIEWQLAELNRRFSEVNAELLLCLTCLSPDDSFIAFDKQKLLRFAEFYPQDFNSRDLLALEDQLEIYITHMRTMTDFSQLKGIGSLARKMVEKGLHRTYNYVYLLIRLALTLPVAIASVERAFSAMNIVKDIDPWKEISWIRHWQCDQNGHIACSSCRTKINDKCPFCSGSIGFNHCRAIEKALESITISCQNIQYGCKESSATQFEYYVIFHVSLNADDNFLVLQEKKGGTLFILKRHLVPDLGNAVTISCIQPGFMGGFFHELDAKSEENFLRLESFTKSTPSRQVIDDRPPKTGFLLIPFDFISSDGQLKMEICIWPEGASPFRRNHVA
ncbi:hypothetical protein L3X38_044025 [Prunus dulcis]|uniref:DUF4371 domain-containing protein n=1 Tax=Prunus dulcis TaxID=3755 RepID=A0AAD4UXX6_PRUDU|nr:hypothetical protein L3X38_044025 [Prunus dulcis]